MLIRFCCSSEVFGGVKSELYLQSLIRKIHPHTARKDFILTIVFLTRIATLGMVLWDDTLVTATYGAHGVATGTCICYKG